MLQCLLIKKNWRKQKFYCGSSATFKENNVLQGSLIKFQSYGPTKYVETLTIFIITSIYFFIMYV